MKRAAAIAAVLSALVVLLFQAASSRAVTSQTWRQREKDDFARGETKGVSLLSDGVLRLSNTAFNVATTTGSTTGGSAQTLTITSVPSGPAYAASSTATFTATLNNTDVTSSTTWASSDTSVVSFSGNTATFGAAGGSATITASTTSSGTCASATLSITTQ